MKIEYTTFLETGNRRANQDICRVVEMPEHNRALMIVCDGMGGHSMGDVAAETVCLQSGVGCFVCSLTSSSPY